MYYLPFPPTVDVNSDSPDPHRHSLSVLLVLTVPLGMRYWGTGQSRLYRNWKQCKNFWLLFFYLFIFVWYDCLYTCIYLYPCMCGHQKLISGDFPNCSLPYILRLSLSVEPRAQNSNIVVWSFINFDIGQLFICVLLESSLWKALYLSLSFKWIVFLLLNCRWSLYILDTKCLLDPRFGNTFLKFYWCASCSVNWSQSQVWMDALMPVLCLNNSILLREMLCLPWGGQSLDSHSLSLLSYQHCFKVSRLFVLISNRALKTLCIWHFFFETVSCGYWAPLELAI